MADQPRAGVTLVTLVCDGALVASGVINADGACGLDVADGLLRLDLLARRVGWSVRLSEVPEDLREFLKLAGVADRLSSERLRR